MISLVTGLAGAAVGFLVGVKYSVSVQKDVQQLVTNAHVVYGALRNDILAAEAAIKKAV